MTCRICPKCGITMDCGGRGQLCDRCELGWWISGPVTIYMTARILQFCHCGMELHHQPHTGCPGTGFVN